MMQHGDWDVGRLLAASGGYWTSAAIHTAVKLDIFTLLDGTKRTAEQLSDALHADLRASTHLLRALVALGLLEKISGSFIATEFSAGFLSKKSPKYMGYIISHHHNLFPSWAKLDEAVISGKPTRKRISHENSRDTENFILGMFNQGMQQAPEMASHLDLSGKKHLLDLGGGPGTYAIHFCLANPGLSATIWDLPTSKTIARQVIEKFGLSKRVSFVSGDFTVDRITGDYDVVFVSHILHGEGPEDCLLILKNAVANLAPGGLVIVHEFILNNTEDGPVFPSLFSLNMLLGTPNGQAYTENELKEMLHNVGLGDVERIPVESRNGAGLIRGTKKAHQNK